MAQETAPANLLVDAVAKLIGYNSTTRVTEPPKRPTPAPAPDMTETKKKEPWPIAKPLQRRVRRKGKPFPFVLYAYVDARLRRIPLSLILDELKKELLERETIELTVVQFEKRDDVKPDASSADGLVAFVYADSVRIEWDGEVHAHTHMGRNVAGNSAPYIVTIVRQYDQHRPLQTFNCSNRFRNRYQLPNEDPLVDQDKNMCSFLDLECSYKNKKEPFPHTQRNHGMIRGLYGAVVSWAGPAI